jgi:hypothetical protein
MTPRHSPARSGQHDLRSLLEWTVGQRRHLPQCSNKIGPEITMSARLACRVNEDDRTLDVGAVPGRAELIPAGAASSSTDSWVVDRDLYTWVSARV